MISDEDLARLKADIGRYRGLPAVAVSLDELESLVARIEQAERVCVKRKNRVDAMRRQRDGYRNQLRKTEQQIQRVRELVLKDTDALLRMNTRSDGLYLSQEILRALDGDGLE